MWDYMNAILRRCLFVVIILSAHLFADAQHMSDIQQDSLEHSHRIMSLDAGTKIYVDSVRRLISAFYVDQFRHFQDPAAPYFLFMSKDANLAMGIGGCVRMRAWYDWGGVHTSGFIPYFIPMHRNPAHTRRFDTTPAGSALFFRVIGRNKTLGNYQLYIQADFSGYESRDFKLKKAYAIINDITIGYANSTFSDPAALPPTIDAAGPNNKLTVTNVLVRWMHTFRHGLVTAFSVESPKRQIDVDNEFTEAVDQWMPDFSSFVQYEWNSSQHVRLAGIVRTLPYRDMKTIKNHNILGWGLQLSSIAKPTSRITCYANASMGKGYASLGGDLLVGNYDLIGDKAVPGKLYAPKSYGWCLGLQYNFKPNLFSVITFSESRYMPDRTVDGSEYKYGLYGAANLFWNMTARMQVGVEYNVGKRCNFNGENRWAQRVGALAQFSF